MKPLKEIIEYATRAHAKTNHFYDGGIPYTYHLRKTAQFAEHYILLIEHDIREQVIAACYCHDIIEDARQSYNDVFKETESDLVADIVYAVTNDKGKNRAERAGFKYYEGIRNQVGATFVKLCDRLANLHHAVETDNYKMIKIYSTEMPSFLESVISIDSKEHYKIMTDHLMDLVLVGL